MDKPNFTVETDHPVALESLDHLHPFGTIKDNNSNPTFIEKLQELGVTSLLDIGCAGGRLVEELNKVGITAVGIEGSDLSKNMKRASWETFPDYLFTADATKPFTVKQNDGRFIFDVVTCWEFFEHIEKNDLSQVLDNIRRHTDTYSQLLCSISNFPSPHDGVDLHRTKEDYMFWSNLFKKWGFEDNEFLKNHYSGNYVRQGVFNFVLWRTS